MSIADVLQSQRRVLLDLTYRNRLLNIPKKPSVRSITIHDELSSEVLRMLLEKKKFTFSGVPSNANEEALPDNELREDESEFSLGQPEEEGLDENGIARRHTDSKLQTKLKSEHLQKRLLGIYYEARTMLEEQGVNVLYLALGQLRFRERDGSEEFRYAPLILVPVELERRTARDRFAVKWNEDDPQENLSLREKLQVDLGVKLPEFPNVEELQSSRYFSSIRDAVASQEGWEVVEDSIQLGFFSFAKLLMFLDLDPARWTDDSQIDQNPLIEGLLGEGFEESDQGPFIDGPASLDTLIPAENLFHVMDCDSTQALAIEAVRKGQNVVIQGPPGTGKSQTIANLISTAVREGKTVLFVAEKMAALDVVKRRLEQVGLGPACLELHSNKSNKRAVIEELKGTLEIGRPAARDTTTTIRRLEQLRTQLNAHAIALHRPIGAAGLTPFIILGNLAKRSGLTEKPAYKLAAAHSWSMEDAEARVKMISDLCHQLRRIGNPKNHSWRGVAHAPVMRPQAEELVLNASQFNQALSIVQGLGDRLAEAIQLPKPITLSDTERLSAIAESLATAPEFDRSTITSGIWSAGIESLSEAVHSGKAFRQILQRRGSDVNEIAWDMDWTPHRLVIAGHGRGWFKWLNGQYRNSVRQLKAVHSHPLPRAYDARISLLDDLLAGRKAHGVITEISTSAKAAFGSVWRGRNTDWELAEAILNWVEAQRLKLPGIEVREIAAQGGDKPLLAELASQVRTSIRGCRKIYKELGEFLNLDEVAFLDGSTLDKFNLSELVGRTASWNAEVDAFMDWVSFADSRQNAVKLDLKSAVETIESSAEAQTVAIEQFWLAFYLGLLEEAIKAYPELPRFEGRRQEDLITEFRRVDRDRLTLAQIEAASAHFEKIPRSTAGKYGTLGTLRGEIARQRGHMALRKLFRLCASPIQAAKPVFMMSPLSVAQFLEPGGISFDLLVIDEASQVQPVDALGAIARSSQIVVVGDDKQLPPTSFFSRVIGDEETDEENVDAGAQAKDLESILSLCIAKGLPQRMLKWHYRSRHESLIAVSNKEFYDGNLFIVPSPDRGQTNSGLRFHYLPNGRFDRGNTQKNMVEAAAITKAIIEHAEKSPHLTLGVGAMSVRQRQAISDEIELARRTSPVLESFIAQHPHEPFFIKNLENVQGDERDVIFISIGYGKGQADDKMYQSFGPLNADGGHRRLNVLITRSRVRCEVFSSITAEDIRVDERSKLGVIALKAFLKYAESGDLGVPVLTGAGADSPFEESVQKVLSDRGFEVDNQVGVAGFFIDLAIVDPEFPGRYLLGIECDGAAYHSAPSARDRDRLRQEVLEAHGWTIHRVWSTDWFQRQEAETNRLMSAIEKARSEFRFDNTALNTPAAAFVAVEIAREAARDSSEYGTILATPYLQASFTPGNSNMQPHEVPLNSMAQTVEKIVEIEGPIHETEIVTRVRELWGLSRAGSRIKTAVQGAIRNCKTRGLFQEERDCYLVKDKPVVIRDRSNAESRTLRNPEYLPPQEIREAIVKLVQDSHGATRDEVAIGVSRMLGFQATSQLLKEIIFREIGTLESASKLRRDSELLTM
jgi:very-short-patch-repair endonuclease